MRSSDTRIDFECAVKLCVKFEGYFTKTKDGVKVYCKGRNLEWVVDKDKYSVLDLIDNLEKHYEWDETQRLSIRYMDSQSGMYANLVTDSQLLDLFDKCSEEKIVRLNVAVVDSSSTPTQCTSQTIEATQSAQPTTVVIDIASQPNDMEVGGEDYVSDTDSLEVESDREYIPNDEEELQIPEELVSGHRERIISIDTERPCIDEGSLFSNIEEFRRAIRQHAILNEYEFKIEKSDKKRFRAHCADEECRWRIHGSVLTDNTTFKVKVNKQAHTCSTTNQRKGKMASKGWVCDKVLKWLKSNSNLGAKDLQQRLYDDFHIRVPYGRVFAGKEMALERLYGKWEDGYSLLYNFKEALLTTCPESLVEIDTENAKQKVCFRRVFVALKPCIDGFLQGCRPYIGIDSTHLTGKHGGQLAAAVAVDGHNLLYPVAYGVIESETTASWEWFLLNLKKAIDTPYGLVISTDACKGLDAAIRNVFSDAEHRECMRHLMKNFTPKFRGPVFKKNMWPAAFSYTIERFDAHMAEIAAKHPEAIEFLRTNHSNLWSRSKFAEHAKVDYVNNNLSESFNSWIMEFKGLQVVDLLDNIRQFIMKIFDRRRRIGLKLKGHILPSVVEELNKKSRGLGNYNVNRSGHHSAEVSARDKDGVEWRHAVHLDRHFCTCRKWQINGKPCDHALAFICSLRGANMHDYIHEYFTVERFRMAYAGEIKPLTDKRQWPVIDPGFKLHPPILRRPAGRPRKQRIKAFNEIKMKRQHRCKRCGGLGHYAKRCKEPVNGDQAPLRSRKRKSSTTSRPRPPRSVVQGNNPNVVTVQ